MEVIPLESLSVIFASCCNRSLIFTLWPCSAARCKGVLFSPLGPHWMFGSAPAIKRICKHLEFSVIAAACNGVLPNYPENLWNSVDLLQADPPIIPYYPKEQPTEPNIQLSSIYFLIWIILLPDGGVSLGNLHLLAKNPTFSMKKGLKSPI